jgi:hypothetical protein
MVAMTEMLSHRNSYRNLQDNPIFIGRPQNRQAMEVEDAPCCTPDDTRGGQAFSCPSRFGSILTAPLRAADAD